MLLIFQWFPKLPNYVKRHPVWLIKQTFTLTNQYKRQKRNEEGRTWGITAKKKSGLQSGLVGLLNRRPSVSECTQ